MFNKGKSEGSGLVKFSNSKKITENRSKEFVKIDGASHIFV